MSTGFFMICIKK